MVSYRRAWIQALLATAVLMLTGCPTPEDVGKVACLMIALLIVVTVLVPIVVTSIGAAFLGPPAFYSTLTYFVGYIALLLVNKSRRRAQGYVNVIRAAVTRGVGTAFLTAGAVAFVSWVSGRLSPSDIGLSAAIAFVFAFGLQVGGLYLGDQVVVIREALERDAKSIHANRELNDSIELELSSWRDAEQQVYVAAFFAPMVAVALVWIHVVPADRLFPAIITVACSLAALMIVRLVGRTAIRLAAVRPLEKPDAVTWDQYRSFFANINDFRTLQLYDAIHSLSMATGYVCVAIAVILNVDTAHNGILLGVVSTIAALIIAALLLFLPFIIGYRGMLNEMKGWLRKYHLGSHALIRQRELELRALRPEFPLKDMKYMLTVLSAGGVLTSLGATLVRILT